MPQRDSINPATPAASARPDLQVIYRRPEELRPYVRNARTHDADQVRQIRASIDEFGFTNPILLRDDADIGAGHGRWEAALLDPPLERIPTITLPGLTDDQWRAYILADNKIALNAGWDEAMLVAEFDALVGSGFDTALTGFSTAELDALVASAEASRTGLIADDEAPPAPVIPVSRVGEAWTLGRHRLVIGDATDAAAVDLLMGTDLADLIWTDPPYNVAIDAKAGAILNDDMDPAAFRAFLEAAFASYHRIARPGAVIYVAHAETERTSFTGAFTGAGFKLSQVRIWVKHSATLGRADYNWQHEPILYGWKPGAGHYFAGDFTLTTVIDQAQDLADLRKPELLALARELLAALKTTTLRHDRPTRSAEHPTMKPVALVQEMVENSSRAGEIVVDLFGGAGSTLIAVEKTARTARLMELDPRYADVIIERWQAFTGREAMLEGAERTFREVSDERRGPAPAQG